jgi:flagellin
MRINNNLMAMNTHRQLGINSSNGSKSIEKLSSGFRINRAGDDAAGLAISEKMRGQIRGLNQASRNSQDAISLVQTAEGALNETQAILQRMRELAVQSASDTNVNADRTAMKNEIDELIPEIDRIGDTTEFNTRKLLNGSAALSATATTGSITNAQGTGDTQVGSSFSATVTLATNSTAVLTATADLAATTSNLTAASSLTVKGTTFSFSTTDTVQDVLDTINNAGLNVTASLNAGVSLQVADNVAGSAGDVDVSGGTGSFGAQATTAGNDATLANPPAGVLYSTEGNTINVLSGTAKGLSFDAAAAGDTVVSVTSNGTLTMQIGANEGQSLNIGLNDMRSSALGISGISISTASSASSAITTINNAITSVSDERAKLGAVQNRLEHTIKNLDTSSENLQASESRIRDVDMAKEMMNFTKNNILQQAAQAMLAQANQAPQGVLQLLR